LPEIIRKARVQDAKRIYEIAKSNSLTQLTKKETVLSGFLVSEFDLDTYIKYIENLEQFYVLEKNGDVKAFILAFKDDELDNDLIVNKRIRDYAKNSYCVIKQVCVDKDCHRKGYATKLYDYYINSVEGDIYLSIVFEPYNSVSVQFHTKMGFQERFTVIAEDNIKRGIFLWVNHNNGNYYDKEIIMKQYDRAVDLYMHEDSLNWSKLNHFFYSTGGLLLVLSFLTTQVGIQFSLYLAIVSIVGIALSLLFYIALNSGVSYMQERKKSVVALEKILINMSGMNVVTANPTKIYLKRAPATKVMKMIPLCSLGIWMLIFMASIVF
jgi:predicted GNAT superfamily acetyltransferase